MRKEKLLAIILFFSLVAENDTVLAYYQEMWTPGRLLEWFTYPLPIKVNVFQLTCLGMLLVCRKKQGSAKPINRAVWVSMLTVLLWMAFGLARGGVVQPIYTQVSAWMSCLLFTLTAIVVVSTPEDFRGLENAIIWAAIWRSCTAITFYMRVRGRDWTTMPQYMTTHEDTVVFVVALLALASRAIEFRSKKALRLLVLATPLILVAIQVNNRRLAWASLAAGVLVLYFMLPAKSRVTRRVNRTLLLLSPVIALYVAVGLGRPEKIFKPLQAFSSMGGSQVDNSTRARDNENMSLITMIKSQPLLGTGLGIEWNELDATFTVPVSVFPMYHYCPHNSVLALLAFCGGIGFAGLWMIIYISVYLNARTYRTSQNPAERSVAVMGIVEVVAYLNQAYGDMGAMGPTHVGPATILAIGIAAAAKLSVSARAWPGARSPAPARSKAALARED